MELCNLGDPSVCSSQDRVLKAKELWKREIWRSEGPANFLAKCYVRRLPGARTEPHTRICSGKKEGGEKEQKINKRAPVSWGTT